MEHWTGGEMVRRDLYRRILHRGFGTLCTVKVCEEESGTADGREVQCGLGLLASC